MKTCIGRSIMVVAMALAAICPRIGLGASPAAPLDPIPADGWTSASVQTAVNWSSGSVPATFSVALSTANPPTTVVGSGLAGTSCTLPTLMPSTTYYWQVTATNDGATTVGPVWHFKTLPMPRQAYSPSPYAGATSVDPNAELSWYPTSGATNEVYFGTTNPPTTKIATTTGSSCSPGLLAASTRYYWKVVSTNSYGTTYGPTWSFKVLDPPDAPANTNPADQATSVATTLTVGWTFCYRATSYVVKVDTVNPPVKVASTVADTALSCAVSGLAPATKYYWQVSAVNAAGSTAGPVWSFTTLPLPKTPFNPCPQDHATSISVNTLLQWNDPGEPVKILAFTGHSNNAPDGNYQKTLAAIRQYFTNFEVTETNAEDTATLKAQLAGKDVFLIPPQTSWTTSNMRVFGTNVGSVVKPFAEGGGLVLIIDAGAPDFAGYAGLMTPNSGYMAGNTISPYLTSSNQFTRGVSSSVTLNDPVYGVFVSFMGDVTHIFEYRNPRSGMRSYVVEHKELGAGNVVLMGYLFTVPNTNMARLLANVVQVCTTGPAIENYDVYLGKTNPPATKIATGTYGFECSPGAALDYQTDYYWQVVANSGGGTVPGPVWTFKTGNPPPPAAPSNLLPADQSTLATLTPRLSWSAATIPATFSVQLDTVNPPVQQFATGLAQAYDDVTTLAAGKTYYWRVTAHNVSGSAAGPVWSFATPPRPAAPSGPIPASTAMSIPIDTQLQWAASTGATSYDVYFGPTNPPTTPIAIGTAATQCSPGTLAYGSYYYWRVIARNTYGSTAGPVWSFQTTNPPPPNPAHHLSPADNSSLTTTAVTLTWSSTAIMATHTVRIGTSYPPNEVVASDLTQTSHKITSLAPGTTYYWSITTENVSGSATSGAWRFTTPALPAMPSGPTPASAATGVALNAQLQWVTPANASSYDVYFGTTNPPATKLASDMTLTQVSPGTLVYATNYYWRVIARNSYGFTQGPVWSFRTMSLPRPSAPANPLPGNNDYVTTMTPTLSWSPSELAKYSVKLDTKNPPTVTAATGLAQPAFRPAPLNMAATYYWQVTATNDAGTTVGPVWCFKTPPLPATPSNPSPANDAYGTATNATLKWNTPTTTTVQILIRGAMVSPPNGLFAAIRTRFTNFTPSYTSAGDTATLAAELTGKQVFVLVVPQMFWSRDEIGAYGAKMGPVLRNFVNAGGLIVVLDQDWGNGCRGGAEFVNKAGLIAAASNTSTPTYENVTRVSNHPILQDVASSFMILGGFVTCSSVGDAQPLIAYSGQTVAAIKPIGLGNVLLIGWDYEISNTDLDCLVGNAISMLNHRDRYDVFFGTTNPPTTKLVSDFYASTWSPGALASKTTYFWRIVARNDWGETAGPVWSFHTFHPAPPAPSQPGPADRQAFVPVNTKLTWAASSVPATYNVKLGTTNPPTTQIATGLAQPTCTPSGLKTSMTYYWQVTSTNETGSTAGPVWRFSTPGLPLAPVNVAPVNKAKLIPLNTMLDWESPSTFELPVQVLAFTGHLGGYRSDYLHLLTSLRSAFTNITVTETSTEDPATMAQRLAGKQVFIVPAQDAWLAMTVFGMDMGAVLKQFVEAGGVVIACENPSNTTTDGFLRNAGLMNVQKEGQISASTLKVATSNILTQGVAATFTSKATTCRYSSIGDATALIKQSVSDKPVAAFKAIGSGMVILLGWDYNQYNSQMSIMLANAVQYVGGAGVGVEHYDVLFGTMNPPTTKLVQGNTYKTICNSPTLQYGKTYYWRVIAHNMYGDTTGPVWSFLATPRTPAQRPWSLYR